MKPMEIKLAASEGATIRHTGRESTYTLLQMLQSNPVNPLTFETVHKVGWIFNCMYKYKGEWVNSKVQQTSEEKMYTSVWCDVNTSDMEYILYRDNISGKLYARDVFDFGKFELIE